MGDFKESYGRGLAHTKLPALHKLSSGTYLAFIKRGEFAVILLDAPWDLSGARALRPVIQAAMQAFGGLVEFGEVEVDGHLDVPASVHLRNVPAVAYCRKGELIEMVIGGTQDLSAHIKALLIGSK